MEATAEKKEQQSKAVKKNDQYVIEGIKLTEEQKKELHQTGECYVEGVEYKGKLVSGQISKRFNAGLEPRYNFTPKKEKLLIPEQIENITLTKSQQRWLKKNPNKYLGPFDIETTNDQNQKVTIKDCLIKVNSKTNSFEIKTTKQLRIPNTMRGVKLTDEDKRNLANEKPITKLFKDKDGNYYTCSIQYNFKKGTIKIQDKQAIEKPETIRRLKKQLNKEGQIELSEKQKKANKEKVIEKEKQQNHKQSKPRQNSSLKR